MMTETGKLPVGVEFEGEVRRDFSIRELTAGDELDAADVCLSTGKVTHGAVEAARIASVLTIDGVPKEKITSDLVRSLCLDDFSALRDSFEALQKKTIPTPVKIA